MNEVFSAYANIVEGKAARLPAAPKYQNFIARLELSDHRQAEQYWQHYLSGFCSPIPIESSISGSTPSSGSTSISGGLSEAKGVYKDQMITLNHAETDNIQRMAKDNHLTVNTLLQGAWGILLSRYCGESDIVFGTTVSGRPVELTNVENMVGLFINTIPLRVKISNEQTVLPYLQGLQSGQLESRAYESTPLVKIHHLSDVPGDQSLFDSILVFENFPMDKELNSDGSLTRIWTSSVNNPPACSWWLFS